MVDSEIRKRVAIVYWINHGNVLIVGKVFFYLVYMSFTLEQA
jgi:hypothetical protein